MPSARFKSPRSIERPELFFALVGAIGTDLSVVTQALEAELCVVGYTLAPSIRLSQLLHGLRDYEHLRDLQCTEDERLAAYMNAGDNFRSRLQDGGALAALAIAEINRQRPESRPQPSTAFLLHSLKHHKEVELLRAIYGSSLIVISIYEPEEARREHLVSRIEKSGAKKNRAKDAAKFLIERDQEDNALGQNVRKTFPLADFFLDASRSPRSQIERLIQLLFQHPEISPTKDEYAMFVAQATALRSADMSRQVGAVIANDDGEIIAAGCNEVPKPGGGVYWTGDDPDRRDFKHGADTNAIIGRETVREIFDQLKKAGWLATEHAVLDASTLVERARKSELFEHSRISNLIEFSRVVHAEMNAVTYAARHGLRIGGQRLYCTTFPCHGCARHIIGAGISVVVYIEPYPKSLAVELYHEEITLDSPRSSSTVAFLAFMGVAPRRYLEFFNFGKRKDKDGYAVSWAPKTESPRIRPVGYPYLLAETDLCDSLLVALEDLDGSST